MDVTTATQIHVCNNFQILIPLSGDADLFVFTQTTSPSFGLTLTRIDTQESYHYQIQILQSRGISEDAILKGLSWAKRTPYQFQKRENTTIIEALVCRLRIATGIFDFRRNKQRAIRFVVRCFSNNVLLSTGYSQLVKVLPKKRLAEGETEETGLNAIIPIFWQLEQAQQSSESDPQQSDSFSPLDNYDGGEYDEDSVMAHFNESDERNQSYSNEADSDDLSMIPASDGEYTTTEPFAMAVNQPDQYMVLYNGNAEVVGNFRALNFYKASDIRIKDDVRLLVDQHDDCRNVLLKIDGIAYRFKPGTTYAAVNRRFVGYIAQQIESVVPEAVQLIDGILHVDYESLIPYLSESIKQNFRDIKDIKKSADKIRHVVDMMYAEFTQQKHRNSEQEKSRTSVLQSRRTAARWIVGSLLAVLALVSVAIAAVSLLPTLHSAPHSAIPSGPSSPQTSPSPLDSTPLRTFPSIDQDVVVEFYHLTGGNWKTRASSNISVCAWGGISCDEQCRVTKIELPSGGLVGNIPSSIRKLSKLTHLILSSNNLEGEIPAALGDLVNLIQLDLSATNFVGTVPLEIFSLPSLQSLHIAFCDKLQWTIPPQISNLTNLRELAVSSSGLAGTIPPEISQLTNLKVLKLLNNQLVGTVPSLKNTRIVNLFLNSNQFNGSMPELPSNVNASFAKIRVARNNFSGEFRLPLNMWENAYSIDFSQNQFTSVHAQVDNVTIGGNCLASSNKFACPIPAWLQTKCGATCK